MLCTLGRSTLDLTWTQIPEPHQKLRWCYWFLMSLQCSRSIQEQCLYWVNCYTTSKNPLHSISVNGLHVLVWCPHHKRLRQSIEKENYLGFQKLCKWGDPYRKYNHRKEEWSSNQGERLHLYSVNLFHYLEYMGSHDVWMFGKDGPWCPLDAYD